jgi:hypothetical protein
MALLIQLVLFIARVSSVMELAGSVATKAKVKKPRWERTSI